LIADFEDVERTIKCNNSSVFSSALVLTGIADYGEENFWL
jgi:hypothetical protein